MRGVFAAAPNPLAAGEWADQAACKGTPLDLWYPEGRGARRETALAIQTYCGGCPVRQRCAMAGVVETWGAWGGHMPKTKSERPKKINMNRSETTK